MGHGGEGTKKKAVAEVERGWGKIERSGVRSKDDGDGRKNGYEG